MIFLACLFIVHYIFYVIFLAMVMNMHIKLVNTLKGNWLINTIVRISNDNQ